MCLLSLSISLVFRRSSTILKDHNILILSLRQFIVVGSVFVLLLLCGLPFMHILYLILPIYLSCVCYHAVGDLFGCNLETFIINWHSTRFLEMRRKWLLLCIYWLLLAISIGKFCSRKRLVDFYVES